MVGLSIGKFQSIPTPNTCGLNGFSLLPDSSICV
jgi:hypothetical protein